MSDDLPPITKGTDDAGRVTYYFWADPTWDGFDSLVRYMKKYWNATETETSDGVYSRRWVVIADRTPIAVYHDSQLGNYFQRNDESVDLDLLERIFSDLEARLSRPG
jgi:hypothetical protein